jgi:predicted ATPase/transcriptional regulator with XRE-family HTH domain
MSAQTSFGALLRRYRQTAGLSQEALAARANLSARAISDLERGINRSPRYDTFTLLVGVLNLSAEQRALLQAAANPDAASVASSSPPPPTTVLGQPSLDLPIPPTLLIGREAERAHVLSAIRRRATRLLTLTGPSGVGKTRLVLQLGQDLAPDFANGVLFVDLEPIRDASLVPAVIAQALGVREQSDSTLAEQVRTCLQSRHLLLILDNLEQVLDSSYFVADLLASCSHLFVLATSRTPLRLRAEQELRLAPLSLSDATELFYERAQAIRPASIWSLTDAQAICEQVDCLPLAIELAAMHVRIFSLPELREQLTRRLALLRGGATDLPIRQQTMENAIAWSYELLSEEQQRCFRSFAVFVGGCTLEAAQAVCGGMKVAGGQERTEEKTILVLAALVDASLVQAEILTSGTTRFRMLELIREYAVQCLRRTGEEEEYRRRHADYYARLAETIAAYFGPEQLARDTHMQWLFADELPNARAALQWAEERQDAVLGLRLTGFARLWHIRGQITEAVRWNEQMLALDAKARARGERAAPPSLRVEKLYSLARILLSRGQVKPAEGFAQEALDLAQRIADEPGISEAFATLGLIAQAEDRIDQAATFYDESYRHSKIAKHSGLETRALVNLGELARIRGDVVRARSYLEEALANAQALGAKWDVVRITTLLGHLAGRQKQYSLAKELYREALMQFRAFGSPNYIAWCLEGYAAAICAEGCNAQATRLCAAATALREQAQTPLPPTERERFEQTVLVARAGLDEQTFSQEWTIGLQFGQDEAIDYALSVAFQEPCA